MHEILPSILSRKRDWYPIVPFANHTEHTFSTASTYVSPYGLRIFNKDDISWIQTTPNQTYIGGGVLDTETGIFTPKTETTLGALSAGTEGTRSISKDKAFVFTGYSSWSTATALAAYNTATKTSITLPKTQVPETLNNTKTYCSHDGRLIIQSALNCVFATVNDFNSLQLASKLNITVFDNSSRACSDDAKTFVWSDGTNIWHVRFNDLGAVLDQKIILASPFQGSVGLSVSNNGLYLSVTQGETLMVYRNRFGSYALVNVIDFQNPQTAVSMKLCKATLSADAMILAASSGVEQVAFFLRSRSNSFEWIRTVHTGFSQSNTRFLTPVVSSENDTVCFYNEGDRPGDAIFFF